MIDLFVEIEAYRFLSFEDGLEVQALLKKCSNKEEALKKCTELSIKLNNKNIIEKYKKDSLLGKRFYNCTFENYKPYNEITKSAYDEAKKYAENFIKYSRKGTGLIIQGNGCVGTGKTHLACSIGNYLMNELCIPVKFGNITNLLEELKKNFGSDNDIIGHLSTINLLILDDLGKELASDWSKSIIYQVINNRYNNLKPILVTTEATNGHLSKVYGDAIPSRIYEMCVIINLTGEDYRLK